MTQFQRDILELVKSALKSEKVIISENFDWEKAFELCKSHQILPILYYGALNSKLNMPKAIKDELEMYTFQCMAISTNQMYEIQKIKETFIENNIDFVLLKGTVLKNMFPKSEMRMMSDTDILIKVSQYNIIEPIMEKLGFEKRVESDHEFVWDKPTLHAELHKRLIPSYNKDYYNYYGDGWRLVHKTKNSCEHIFSDEDALIYIFTHFAKHYRDAGVGIRHIVDIYIYLLNKPNLNNDYIKTELQRLQLLDFYENCISTLQVWFAGKTESDITNLITEVIFKSGSYGTSKVHVLSEALKTSKSIGNTKNVKRKKFLRAIFPSAAEMCFRYPFLKRFLVLMPFMWIVRIFAAVTFRRDNIKRQQNRIGQMSAENIISYQDSLNFVGLDFNFKE